MKQSYQTKNFWKFSQGHKPTWKMHRAQNHPVISRPLAWGQKGPMRTIASALLVIAFSYIVFKGQIYGLTSRFDKVLGCLMPTIVILAAFMGKKRKPRVYYPIDYVVDVLGLFCWAIATLMSIDKMFGLGF